MNYIHIGIELQQSNWVNKKLISKHFADWIKVNLDLDQPQNVMGSSLAHAASLLHQVQHKSVQYFL